MCGFFNFLTKIQKSDILNRNGAIPQEKALIYLIIKNE